MICVFFGTILIEISTKEQPLNDINNILPKFSLKRSSCYLNLQILKRNCWNGFQVKADIICTKQIYPLQIVRCGITHSCNTFKKTLKVSLKDEKTHLKSKFDVQIFFMRVVGDFCKIYFYVLFASLFQYHHANPSTVGTVKQQVTASYLASQDSSSIPTQRLARLQDPTSSQGSQQPSSQTRKKKRCRAAIQLIKRPKKTP